MQNSMFTLFAFNPKYRFGADLGQNEMKFGNYINLKIENSMTMLTFSALDQKYHFWASLI